MNVSERLVERLLSNSRSQRVRDVAALSRRSVRSKQGLFRAEGPQNVREALTLALAHPTADGVPDVLPVLDAVYVTLEELERHPQIAGQLAQVMDRGGVFVRAVSAEVLDAMTDAMTPQGMLCVCRVPEVSIESVLSGVRLVSVQVRVQDPGNAGTLIRVADASGADLTVFTSGSVDPYNPKAVRSTAGSIFHVPVITGVDIETVVSAAQDAGFTVVAADGYADLTVDQLADQSAARQFGHVEESATVPQGYGGGVYRDYTDAPVECRLEDPTMWLFGNEAHGLSSEEKLLAHVRVAVPLHGAAESLNVGMAATVCMYASARAQRRAARL